MKALRISLAAVAAFALVAGMASCKGRTQENAEANGDTVTLDGGVVDMPADSGDVIADSPAEAATPDSATPADETAPSMSDTPAPDAQKAQ